ncbi:MAG TPA: ATP-dependent DNA helicase UvrD2 [Gaiellaceae bacterium]|nr:ATP-dependent DNA helicase UvrD2 [Gaiellaceae bacterium]
MILEGLNPEQRRAAEQVTGPVCILAGAGSGKTTTITRRIANQVATGAFETLQILAVTFTDKAAGELRTRLEALGAPRIQARTFHSAALRQLTHFEGGPPGKILPSKAVLLRQIANGLPRPYRFRPAGDLATEIEWAKNRRIGVADYLDRAVDPPVPADLMLRVYRDYERRKAAAGAIDFEDLLERAVRLFDERADAAEEFRSRYLAFTVDEYQDVNLLQQELLDRWLGGRDELCVVGDDYQSIYGFTGASAEHLLALPRRFPHALVVRLEENYRSTPQILALANRLVPKLGGAEKTLRAVRPAGLEPELVYCADEGRHIVERIRALGIPHEEIAILCRTNARLADFEEALHSAEIPYQGSSLLERNGARQLLRRLRDLADVRSVAHELGWLPELPEGLGEREETRQRDLGRLVTLAESFDGDAQAFRALLEARYGRSAGEGVHLLTLHRAKGLEFEAVFVPRVEEQELPLRRCDEVEERRLLYVGLTRAKRHLTVTWTGKPSRFLRELGVEPLGVRVTRVPDAELPPAFAALKAWRLERAKADAVPAYVVFHNSTLEEIALRSPRSRADLAAVPGVGAAKLERYGDDVLSVLASIAQDRGWLARQE